MGYYYLNTTKKNPIYKKEDKVLLKSANPQKEEIQSQKTMPEKIGLKPSGHFVAEFANAPVNVVSVIFEPLRSALERLVLVKSAPLKFAFVKSA